MTPKTGKRNHSHRGLTQALRLQDLAAHTAEALRESLSASHSAKSRVLLARAVRDTISAWDTARDAVRILRGKGLPTRVPEKTSRRKLAPSNYQILDLEDVTKEPPKLLPAPAEPGDQTAAG